MTAETLPTVGLVGAGRVASALAAALAAAGYPVTAVASRSRASAEALAARTPGARAVPSAQCVADAADVVFITTTDSAIEAVAGVVRWRPGQVVVHCSGAAMAAVLAPARERGAAVASFHPIATFPKAEPPSPLAGVTFGAEGDEAALAVLAQAARAMGARMARVRPERKALYHAGGVFACNYLVTLLAIGEQLMVRAGLEPAAAREALTGMMRDTVEHARTMGPEGALTGPIARGDTVTVRRHLAALEAEVPALAALYRALGAETLPLARRGRGLEEDATARLQELLTPTTGG